MTENLDPRLAVIIKKKWKNEPLTDEEIFVEKLWTFIEEAINLYPDLEELKSFKILKLG
jgi:hypothetical protein